MCKNARSPGILSYREQSRKCGMSIGLSLMPTETKIKNYLRKRMFSSIGALVFIFTLFPHELFISAS